MSTHEFVRATQSVEAYNPLATQTAGATLSRTPVKVL